MALATYTVPGVYRAPQPRAADLPRVRTDVAGFVGVAGPNRLHQAVRLDDWRSYQEIYLRDERCRALAPPAGARLSETVRAYFTNGGARCWVVNIAPAVDAVPPRRLLSDMLGLPRDPMPTVNGRVVLRLGLEELLAQDEVAIVGLPELDATLAVTTSMVEPLPPRFESGHFGCCEGSSAALAADPPDLAVVGPLFSPDEILDGQRALLDRCERERWRVFALIAPPEGTTVEAALRWRTALGTFRAGALYWPWLLAQEKPGAAVVGRSPIGYVAGIFARRDLAQGPHIAPANESVLGVVGLEEPIDDRVDAQVYDQGINVLRSFPGAGVKLWGARTLAWSPELGDKDLAGFVNVRRGLSAVERNAASIGQRAAFEPNLPLLRMQVAQAMVSYLLSVLGTGALAGATPAESFFVRCDAKNNPAEVVDAGQLICEVGVAIAAPAEFVVFRVGRKEGVVEIQEGD